MMRLDKYLAERTGMTRSESRKAITKGRVMVAGKICRKADTQMDETAAQIALVFAVIVGMFLLGIWYYIKEPAGRSAGFFISFIGCSPVFKLL